MKKVLLTIFALVFAVSANAQTTKWNFDEAHSKIGFSVTHMMIAETEGKFHKYEGEVLSDQKDFLDAKISFTVHTESIDTDNDKRDGHLRSADFFDSKKFPKITFVGTKMTKVRKGIYKLEGKFTMLGVTKDIALEVAFKGMKKDPWGNIRAGFKLSGMVDRTDFGLKYNSALDAGGVMIGEEVQILCNIELIKEKA